MKYLSTLKRKNLNGKICLLRVDLNIKSGESLDSSPRVLGILPTIRFLASRGAKVIILSHRGRPMPAKLTNSKFQNPKPENFSLRPFARVLSKLLKQPVKFIGFNYGTSDVPKLTLILRTSDVLDIRNSPSGKIFLLENLRFWPGEEKNDKKFAKELAALGNFYVNDAFAVSHRTNASVVAITGFLPSYAGLLLEQEIGNLSRVMKSPKKPLVVILGGAKISEKLGLMKNFMNKTNYFLIGGGIANTFVAAQGLPVGESLYEKEMISVARKFLKSKKIMLPVDFKITHRRMLDIGPKTSEKYGKVIRSARTIIWNGPMGYIEAKKFRKGSEGVLKAVLKSRAFAVIGGGETTTLIQDSRFKIQDSRTFVSTGGGAMLEFLAGKKLPGIEALK